MFFLFQYICYPWKNDSIIEPKNRRKTCRIDNDCEQGQECFRHHDKRMVNRGLCFDEVSQQTADSWVPFFNFISISRSKTAKMPTNAVRVINVAAALAAKKNTTKSLPNYHAFLT